MSLKNGDNSPYITRSLGLLNEMENIVQRYITQPLEQSIT